MSVALITGAAHGQGRAVALALAQDGYDIVALDIGKPLEIELYDMGSTDELASLGDAVAALGRECLTAIADVRDDAAVSAAVAAAIERFGTIDVLFNNAGICAYGLAHELTEPEWDAMLDINLKGAWIVARRVIPHMIEAKSGVIVNNSSIAGLRGMGRLSHYAASKWGLTGLTKSWAIELAPHGIRVVSIHPPASTRRSTTGWRRWRARRRWRSPSSPRATCCRCRGWRRATSPRPCASSSARRRAT